jgi:hypothetical protein
MKKKNKEIRTQSLENTPDSPVPSLVVHLFENLIRKNETKSIEEGSKKERDRTKGKKRPQSQNNRRPQNKWSVFQERLKINRKKQNKSSKFFIVSVSIGVLEPRSIVGFGRWN